MAAAPELLNALKSLLAEIEARRVERDQGDLAESDAANRAWGAVAKALAT